MVLSVYKQAYEQVWASTANYSFLERKKGGGMTTKIKTYFTNIGKSFETFYNTFCPPKESSQSLKQTWLPLIRKFFKFLK